MLVIHRRWLLVSLAAVVVGCEPKGDGPDSRRQSGEDEEFLSYGKIVLTSSDLDLTSAGAETSGANCGFSMDIYRGDGYCLTPAIIRGQAVAVYLHGEGFGASTRILAEDEATAGAGEIISGGTFDFSDPTNSELVGNNQLFEKYKDRPAYTHVSVEMAYVRTQVYLGGKYVTVQLASHSQPFADQAREACDLDAETVTQQRYLDADVVDGMEFERGDYMFCVKESATAECESSDYQWLDLDSTALVSARPVRPKTAESLSEVEIGCTDEGDGRISFNLKPLTWYATIPTASRFKLYADFSHGSMSYQWPTGEGPLGDSSGGAMSPYLIYYYVSSAGEEASGSNLEVKLDFDPAESAFVEGMRDVDITSATLATALKNFHFKSIWAADKKTENGVEGGGGDHLSGMAATATITLTGGVNPPTAKEKL